MLKALDRLIYLEKNLPANHGVKITHTATIRLDLSPVYDYVEVRLNDYNEVLEADLHHGDESAFIPPASPLYAWVEDVIAQL